MRARGHLLVFLVAVLAQAWVLGMPFQLDDYYLLNDPGRFFDPTTAYADVDVPPFMLRWTQWAAWSVLVDRSAPPFDPVPFHLLGLLLHGLTAVFLARCVHAFAPKEGRDHAGLVAGIGFGVALGHMQAVSWISAWSSLFYTLFALIALDRLLVARRREGVPALVHRLLACLALYLALVSKTPAMVVVPALGAVVVFAGSIPWRRRLIDAALVAGVFALGLLTRLLYLGHIDPRYYEQEGPGILGTVAGIPRGFAALGQALYPWNADPLFAGEEPILARLGLGAPTIAWAVALLVLVVAAIRTKRSRQASLVLVLALACCVLPAAEIYSGAENNLVSRTVYLPMAVLMAGLGIAGASLLAWRRVAGVAAIGLVAVLLVDGGIHAARTEILAGRDVESVGETLASIAADYPPDDPDPFEAPIFLVIEPEPGFGGIPALGAHLEGAFRPPFFTHGWSVYSFKNGAALRRELPDLELHTYRGDVIVLGPECDEEWNPLTSDPEASGAENRARRRLRPLTDQIPGVRAEDVVLTLATDLPGTRAWTLNPPLSGHALAFIGIDVDGPSTGELVAGSTPMARYTVEAEEGEDFPVEPTWDLNRVFGPPVTELTWRGEGAPPEIMLGGDPLGLAVLCPEWFAEFPIRAPDYAPPRWTVRLPAHSARFARIELTFRTHYGERILFYCDFDLAGARETVDLMPATVHFHHDAPPSDPPLPGLAWDDFVREHVLPLLNQGHLRRITLDWRVVLHRADGGVTARSDTRRLRLVPAE